jgi:phosphopantetheinyl transferase (holo-ACP synthase)
MKVEKRYHLGRDVSPEIRKAFGHDFKSLPQFFLMAVDLAALGADEDALSRTAGEVLTNGEMKIFEGFRFPRRRREWLAGRLAVKEAVCALLAQATRPLYDIEIGVDSRGKPFLLSGVEGANPVYISISHSGDSALGLASPVPCALDFQEIRSSLARVEAKFARVNEALRLVSCHPDRLAALGLLWAGKEALRKYVNLWPLLGFFEADLDKVVAQGDGFLLSFQTVPGKRELPPSLPLVLAKMCEDSALAIILAGCQMQKG